MANGEWRVGLRSVDLGDMAFLECPIKLDDGWDSSSLFPVPYSLLPFLFFPSETMLSFTGSLSLRALLLRMT